MQDTLYLGNLDAQRDWGLAKDYVEGMWRMLQQDHADDYVLATGRTVAIRTFVEMAFKEVGIGLEWQGKGAKEKGVDRKTGAVLVAVDPRYFRPTEVDLLVGDATKAKEVLGWTPSHSLEQLCAEMVASDVALFKRDKYLLDGGTMCWTNTRSEHHHRRWTLAAAFSAVKQESPHRTSIALCDGLHVSPHLPGILLLLVDRGIHSGLEIDDIHPVVVQDHPVGPHDFAFQTHEFALVVDRA